jgi:hypothetical protein
MESGSAYIPRLVGEESPRAKLTEKAVRYIRASNETNRELGERFGVTPENISAVRKRITWRHVE